MPTPMRRTRRKPAQSWIFGARDLPADDITPADHVADGRPTLDDGRADNADRLLERLREVHGDQGRPDLIGTPRAR